MIISTNGFPIFFCHLTFDTKRSDVMLHSNVTLLPSITAYELFDISTIGKSKTKKNTDKWT